MTDYAKEPQPPQPPAPARRWNCALHHASGTRLTGCPDCLSEALLIATQALVEISVPPDPFSPLRPKEIADAAMTKLRTISVRS